METCRSAEPTCFPRGPRVEACQIRVHELYTSSAVWRESTLSYLRKNTTSHARVPVYHGHSPKYACLAPQQCKPTNTLLPLLRCRCRLASWVTCRLFLRTAFRATCISRLPFSDMTLSRRDRIILAFLLCPGWRLVILRILPCFPLISFHAPFDQDGMTYKVPHRSSYNLQGNHTCLPKTSASSPPALGPASHSDTLTHTHGSC